MSVRVKYSSELYHHGIKGQKWGVRRYQNEDGTLTPEGKKRYGVSTSRYTLNKDNLYSEEGQKWLDKATRTSFGIKDKGLRNKFEKEILKKGRSIEFDLDTKRALEEDRKQNILSRISAAETGYNGRMGRRKVNYRVRGKDEADAKKLRRNATIRGAAVAALLLGGLGAESALAVKDYTDKFNDGLNRQAQQAEQVREYARRNGINVDYNTNDVRPGSIGDPNRYTKDGNVKKKYRKSSRRN